MKKNNVQLLNAVDLQQIKNANRKDGKGLKVIAKEYGISYGAAKCAVASKNVNDFKRLLAEYNGKENEAAKARRIAKKRTVKAEELKAAAPKDSELGYAYTPAQVKRKLDAAMALAESTEERLETVVQLLITSPDNLVTRITKLEGRKGLLRRFLDRF